MRNPIRAMPARVEALIVLIGAFGYPVVSSIYLVISQQASPHISEEQLRSLLILEPIVLLVLGALLWARGWTAQRLGLLPGLRDTLIGLGLGIGAYAAFFGLWLLCRAMNLQASYLEDTSLVSGPLRLLTVVAVCAVNALYEELFVCGYLITLARERGRLDLGVNTSIALRLTYHLYQGGMGVVSIIPVGLVFALWYRNTARLWPVIVAHAAIDLVGLLQFVG